jgi:hypothetical protein
MTEVATFVCSICDEPSTEICVYCTKDACRNHRCERCKRCSDCCECEVPLTASEAEPQPDFEVAAMAIGEATVFTEPEAILEPPAESEAYGAVISPEPPAVVETDDNVHSPEPSAAPETHDHFISPEPLVEPAS